MSCDGLNVELRQWVRYSSNNLENPVLNASDGSIVISADSEWLKFVQVKLEHAGDYRCLLRNDLGLKRIFVTVHVVGKGIPCGGCLVSCTILLCVRPFWNV